MADTFDVHMDTLPDLPDEKTREQIVLEQKVFRVNEKFIQRHQEIIQWLLSPEELRKYPDCAKNNRYGFRKRASRYKYIDGILY